MTISNRRYTAKTDKPFVVFLVGMRVNQMRHVRKWGAVASAFSSMLTVLRSQHDTGFLGGEQFFRVFPLTTIFVSYWETLELLEEFATGKGGVHAVAWANFTKEIASSNTVGVWHETYSIAPHTFEARYVNMPPFGLSKSLNSAVDITRNALDAARGS